MYIMPLYTRRKIKLTLKKKHWKQNKRGADVSVTHKCLPTYIFLSIFLSASRSSIFLTLSIGVPVVEPLPPYSVPCVPLIESSMSFCNSLISDTACVGPQEGNDNGFLYVHFPGDIYMMWIRVYYVSNKQRKLIQ